MRDTRFPILDDAFARLQQAASDAARVVTPAQAESGEYAKGETVLYGLPLVIENARNSVRTGTSESGKKWANRMNAIYAEIAGTIGADGEPVDVFVGPFPESRTVWIINQGWPDGGFDEHKAMLGFATADQARDAYLYSFDRDWRGLQSMFAVTVDQFKWWLANADLRRAFSPDLLPFDGTPAMNTTQWDKDAQPVTPMQRVIYDLRSDDKDSLLLDSVTMSDFLADPDVELLPAPILDALVVQVSKMGLKMTQLEKIMNAAGGDITSTGYTISDPMRLRGTLQVCVLFPLSDGQAVSIWFHNPDTTPNKLKPMDELVSWKWMLNKKDVTIVVAPERGKDLNPREVARRVMRLAARNSAAFQKANANAVARVAEESAIDEEINTLTTELSSLQTQIEVAKVHKEEQAALQADPVPDEDDPLTKARRRMEGSDYKSLSNDIMQSLGMIGAIDNGTAPGMDRALFVSSIAGKIRRLSMRDEELAGILMAMVRVGQRALPKPALADHNSLWNLAPGFEQYMVLFEKPAEVAEPEAVVEPQPDLVPARSGTPEEQAAADAALSMAAGVVADLGGTFSADGFAGDGTLGAWSYGNAEVNGKTIRLAASGGGVVQVNRAPHGPDGSLNLAPEQVRASILAVAPAPEAQPEPELAVEPVVEVAPEVAEPEPAAVEAAEAAYSVGLVDATYLFGNATDVFKERIAFSVGADDYSPFLTAMRMDQAALAVGASIAWDVGSVAVMDSADSGPSDGDLIEFTDDKHTDKGPATSTIASSKTTADGLVVTINFGDGDEHAFSWDDLKATKGKSSDDKCLWTVGANAVLDAVKEEIDEKGDKNAPVDRAESDADRQEEADDKADPEKGEEGAKGGEEKPKADAEPKAGADDEAKPEPKKADAEPADTKADPDKVLDGADMDDFDPEVEFAAMPEAA